MIVDETANLPWRPADRLRKGAQRGQTCVEPDYLLIQDTVKEAFGREFQKALDQFFPGGDYSNLPVIVNQKHYERLKGLLKGQKAAVGGGWDDGKRQIFPTLL